MRYEKTNGEHFCSFSHLNYEMKTMSKPQPANERTMSIHLFMKKIIRFPIYKPIIIQLLSYSQLASLTAC